MVMPANAGMIFFIPFQLRPAHSSAMHEMHFDKLGKQLPPGQELLVEITDIDLAGRENVGRWPRDLRIVAGVDWPRINMRFSVVSQGQVVRSGDLQLRDMAFKDRHSRYSNGDGLRYEKRMLDDWFQLTVAPQERTARR
jgi:hypothetical protein